MFFGNCKDKKHKRRLHELKLECSMFTWPTNNIFNPKIN